MKKPTKFQIFVISNRQNSQSCTKLHKIQKIFVSFVNLYTCGAPCWFRSHVRSSRGKSHKSTTSSRCGFSGLLDSQIHQRSFSLFRHYYRPSQSRARAPIDARHLPLINLAAMKKAPGRILYGRTALILDRSHSCHAWYEHRARQLPPASQQWPNYTGRLASRR